MSPSGVTVRVFVGQKSGKGSFFRQKPFAKSLSLLTFAAFFHKYFRIICYPVMNWIESLLWDPASVAHIVFLYAFVVSVGVLLGKIKFFGVSLGVTFVLFMGILMGHFGFTAETHILHFLRDFGLILFVFCIGLQVGPSFFS